MQRPWPPARERLTRGEGGDERSGEEDRRRVRLHREHRRDRRGRLRAERTRRVVQHGGERELDEGNRQRRIPDCRGERHVVRRRRDDQCDRERQERRTESLPDRRKDTRIRRRLDDAESDTAGVRKILGPRTDEVTDRPERPEEHGAERGAADRAEAAADREVVPGAERDPPVENLVAEQPERLRDAARPDERQVAKQYDRGGDPCAEPQARAADRFGYVHAAVQGAQYDSRWSRLFRVVQNHLQPARRMVPDRYCWRAACRTNRGEP